MTEHAAADEKLVPWSRWYREAREEMEFRYGLRRIPVDTWKGEYFMGKTPAQAARYIAHMTQAYGRYCG